MMSIKVLVFLFFCCSFSLSQLTTPGPSNSPMCFKNSGGKDVPSEEKNLHSCKIYGCSSCCTEEVTGQLAKVPLGMVGIVDYAQCGEMTDACSEETTFLQCFFQCSPNLTPWINPVTKLVSKVPICASFCNAWFDKCETDKTCATGDGDWKTITQREDNGEFKTTCREGNTCRNYSTIYQNGQNLCNNIWGDYFKYTPDNEFCLHPSNPKLNSEAILKHFNNTYKVSTCFQETVSYTDAGLIVGIVLGVIAGLCLVAALVYFLLNRNKDKKEPKSSKNVELAPPEEMTLRGGKSGSAADGHNSDSDHSAD